MDGDDNGSLHSSGGLRSAAFTLAEGTEPTAETPDNDPTTPDGNENLTVDFGIVPTFSLGNEIWLDFNDDGIRDAVEITVPDGTVVNLLDANGNAVLDAAGQPRTTTTVNGLYLFDGLLAGGYIVEIPASQFAIGAALEGTRSSTPTSVDDSIAADGTDHGAASNHGIRTGVIDLSRAAEALGEAPDNDAVTPDGNENLTWDIGLVPLFSLGNEVWYDADDDGIKASDEDYVADGVIVNLYDPADLTTPIRSTQILNGLYRFTGLFAGTYVVELAPENFAPGGLIGAARSSTPTADPDQSPTDQDDNGSDTTNAAAARVIRSSVTLTWLAEPTAENPDNESTIPDRNSNLTVDFGVVRLVAVGDYVWYDANNNGIQDPTELPVPNVGVALLMEDPANRDTFIPALDSLGAPVTATTTDAAGYYVFDNLLPGRYEIQFDVATLPTGYTVAKRDRGSDIHVDSNPDSTGLTPPFLLSPLGTLVNPAMVGNNDPMVLAGAINPTIDMGIYRPVSVGDLVWYDANRDGIYDPATESGLADVTVTLLMEDPTNPGTFIAATDDERRPIAPRLTGADGRYAFTHLIENTYRVEFTLPNGYRWTRTDQGLDDTLDSDATFTTTADATATSADRFVSALTPVADSDPAGLVMTDPSFDAGVWVPLAIGDRVWFDLDRNGTQDAGETSVVGAGVILLQETSPGVFTPAVDADGVAVPTDQVTDANGLYLFDNLLPGVYQVTFTHHQPGYRWTTVDSGSDAADSDAIFVAPADPSASTGRIDLQIGAIAVRPVVPADVATYGSMIATYLDPTNDAGIWIPLAVGDYVWFDLNHNGVQDVGEKPVGGVGVSLLVDDPANPGTLIPAIDADGNPVATTTTDTVTGRYLFDNLLPGTYRIQFDLATLPTGYVPSKQTQGADTTIDSNADQAGLTPPFTLAPAGGNMVPNNDPTINAAMIDPTIDLGIFTSVTLGDLVWYDADRNGVFDPATEHGITAVQVELLMEDPATPGTYIAAIDADGAPVAASFTDVDGRYSFTNLVSGKFKVVFSLPSGFEWTPAGQGADATLDSNAGYSTTTDATATSGVITVFADAAVGDSDANGLHLTDPSVDAGVWLPFAIGDQVWFDLDHNGAQDPTETPVAGATAHLVMAVADGSFIAATDADGNPVADATTDANGYYLFDYLLPGVYKVEFTHARSGYEWTSANTAGDALDSDAVYATATDPMAATGPITLSYGAVSVRGTTPADDTTYGTAVRASYVDPTNDAGIWVPLGVGNYVWFDANHNGLQDDGELPVGNVGVALWMDDGTGVFVPARDADGNAVATTTTDALTGMYSFDNLVPGTYQVRFDLATLPAGYVPTTPSAGADAGLDSNPDLTGLSGQFTLSATGANMVANADGTLHASLIDPTIDMGIWQPLAIGDVVWNDIDHDGVQDQGEAPVPGVKVELLTATGMPATDGNGNLVPPATTDAAGHYVFDSLFAGDYQIRFTLPAGFIVTTRGAGADPLVDSNTAPTGLTPVFTLSNDSPEVRPTTAGDGVTVAHLIDPSIDAGIWQPLAIGDFVWYDLNHNGLQDAGEQPVAGVTVTLLSADGSAAFDADGLPVTPTTTDANGHYVFDNLVAGDYRVRFSTLPSGYLLTTSATGTDRLVDSNPAGDGLTAVFTLQAESAVVRPVAVGDGVTVATLIDPSIDAGIWIPLAIGDVVWFDTNHNGVQDQGERPVPGVRVELLNADGSAAIGGDGQPVPAATTDANGRYVFDNLPAGDYQIRFSGLPVGYEFTTPTALSATTGSDSTPARTGLTATFTLSPGAFDVRAVTAADGTTLAVLINPTIDAGIWQPLAIGDIVFLDTTENGRQDPGEKPVPGIKVELLNADGSPALDADGRPVAAVTTDSNGHYLFDNLLPGDYQVQFSNIPQGYTFTEPSTAGSSSSDDSNPSTTGRTPVFHLDGAAADVRPGTGTDGTSHMVNPTIDAGLIAPGPGVLPGTGTNAIDIVRLAMIVGALGAALLIASRRRRRVAGAAR